MIENKLDNQKFISFMFPITSGKTGGVQILIINVIKYLSSQNNLLIRLYDYSSGFIRNELEKSDISNYEFINLDSHHGKIPNKGNETFVLTNELFMKYAYELAVAINVKILVWDVYYPFWPITYNIKGIQIIGLKKKIIKLLASTNSVIFMDSKSLEFFNQEKIIIKNDGETVVPVPINELEYKYKYKYKENFNLLKIGYISRSVDWKVSPIIKMLEDLSKLHMKFVLIIVTDDTDYFQSKIVIPPNTKVVFHKNITGEKLKELILSDVDIGFSMGTAALDFAKYGIPTIIADFSFGVFPENYLYRWIYEYTSHGSLGLEVNFDTDIYNQPGVKLGVLLKSFISDHRSISMNCFQYVKEKHFIDETCKKLLKNIELTTLTPNHLIGWQFKIYYLYHFIVRKIKKARQEYWSLG